MSNWITDRRPTHEDDGPMVYGPDGNICHLAWIKDGDAWKPIPKCEPYVKPKRWEVDHSGGELWGIFDQLMGRYAYPMLPTREAAERIAALYEEVMP